MSASTGDPSVFPCDEGEAAAATFLRRGGWRASRVASAPVGKGAATDAGQKKAVFGTEAED